MLKNWSVPTPDVSGSAESELCVCVCATVRKKLETEWSNEYVSEKEKSEWVCTACVRLFVSRLEMKLGHSLQLSWAEDKLAAEVG